MKFLIFLCLITISFSSFAQNRFIVSQNKNVLRSLKSTKQNHLIILEAYRLQIDSEIIRLVQGIEYELANKTGSTKIKAYERLLLNLLVKKIFVKELEKQLHPLDLDRYFTRRPIPQVFNTASIKLNLEDELNTSLDSLTDLEKFGLYFINDLKDRLIKETVYTMAIKSYQSIGTGLFTKIIANGVTTAALKSAVMSLGAEIFYNAAYGSIMTILVLPLQAYRLPPETIWTDILKKHPELILNPEWMTNAGSKDDPWYTHGYSILRKTKLMEQALTNLINSEEGEFQSAVLTISKMPEVSKKKIPGQDDYIAKRDRTYVHPKYTAPDFAPFWALKKK